MCLFMDKTVELFAVKVIPIIIIPDTHLGARDYSCRSVRGISHRHSARPAFPKRFYKPEDFPNQISGSMTLKQTEKSMEKLIEIKFG